jgi:hypothetical protein
MPNKHSSVEEDQNGYLIECTNYKEHIFLTIKVEPGSMLNADSLQISIGD